MISVSTLSRRLFITLILSETLAPPRIATNGRTGFSTASPRNLISFSIRYPTTFSLQNLVTPTFEQCALCAVPNASFTKILSSQSAASSFAYSTAESSLPYFVSSALYLVFSNKRTSPSLSSAASFLVSSPVTLGSETNFTFTPSLSESAGATGARLISGNGSPFGFPRCEQRITLAPPSRSFFIVGIAPSIRL